MAVDPKEALAHDVQRLADLVRDARDLATACKTDAGGDLDRIAEALSLISPACDKAAQTAVARVNAVLADATPRELLFKESEAAEGDPYAIEQVRKITQLYFEVTPANFPFDGDVRWFEDGLRVVGAGDDPIVYQTPMNRLDGMVVPRAAPKKPWLRARS